MPFSQLIQAAQVLQPTTVTTPSTPSIEISNGSLLLDNEIRPSSTFTSLPSSSIRLGGVLPVQPRPILSTPGYHLTILQQPHHARLCGYATRERRPVDPPPIIKVTFPGSHENEITPSRFVVQVQLYDISLMHRYELVELMNHTSASKQASFTTRALLGTLTCAPVPLLLNELLPHEKKDETLPELCSVFSDISIRCEGDYRLLFRLIGPNHENKMKIYTEVASDILHVYSAKRFPGMTSSTALSRACAAQGIKIPLRQGKRLRIDSSSESDD